MRHERCHIQASSYLTVLNKARFATRLLAIPHCLHYKTNNQGRSYMTMACLFGLARGLLESSQLCDSNSAAFVKIRSVLAVPQGWQDVCWSQTQVSIAGKRFPQVGSGCASGIWCSHVLRQQLQSPFDGIMLCCPILGASSVFNLYLGTLSTAGPLGPHETCGWWHRGN